MKISAERMSYLVAIPMLIMGWHVFEFYSTEPFIVRLGLAASFDLLVFLVFHILKEEDVKKKQQIQHAVYAALALLITFQTYVNIDAYISQMSTPRAIVSGVIFPAIAALLSYISVQRSEVVEKIEQKQSARRVKANVVVTPSPVEKQKSSLKKAELDKTWKGQAVTREAVEKAVVEGMQKSLFSGCTNRNSLNRWWKEYEEKHSSERTAA